MIPVQDPDKIARRYKTRTLTKIIPPSVVPNHKRRMVVVKVRILYRLGGKLVFGRLKQLKLAFQKILAHEIHFFQGQGQFWGSLMVFWGGCFVFVPGCCGCDGCAGRGQGAKFWKDMPFKRPTIFDFAGPESFFDRLQKNCRPTACCDSINSPSVQFSRRPITWRKSRYKILPKLPRDVLWLLEPDLPPVKVVSSNKRYLDGKDGTRWVHGRGSTGASDEAPINGRVNLSGFIRYWTTPPPRCSPRL